MNAVSSVYCCNLKNISLRSHKLEYNPTGPGHLSSLQVQCIPVQNDWSDESQAYNSLRWINSIQPHIWLVKRQSCVTSWITKQTLHKPTAMFSKNIKIYRGRILIMSGELLPRNVSSRPNRTYSYVPMIIACNGDFMGFRGTFLMLPLHLICHCVAWVNMRKITGIPCSWVHPMAQKWTYFHIFLWWENTAWWHSYQLIFNTKKLPSRLSSPASWVSTPH